MSDLPDRPHSDFDPLAPETFDSPYVEYAELRGKCPVAYSEAWNGFWAFLTYDDVRQAATDSETFITSVQNVVPKVAFTGRRPPLHLDPPEHTPYRAALNPLFGQARMEALEPAIRRFTVGLLEPLLARGEGNICDDVSSQLPIQVFADWMNIRDDQADALRATGRAYNVAVQSNQDDVVKSASLELYEFARDIVAERKARPLDPTMDPTSALLAARHKGEPLPDAMIIATVRQVLVVGIIAPTVLIGSFTVHLARDQALQDELRRDPSLIPAAMEELLRLYTPYRGFARTTTCPVQRGGRTIQPGEPIALVYASANRDETKFPEPDRFIIDRPNIGEHLGFGRGPHNCPGAPLGRLTLRVVLEELLARTRRFELNGPITPTRFPEIGALSVPVRLWPA